MSMTTSVVLVAIGAVLIGASCVAYGVVAGFPDVRLPLGSPWAAVLFFGGVVTIAVPGCVVAYVRRSRRNVSQAAEPTHGGVGSAANKRTCRAHPPTEAHGRSDTTMLLPPVAGCQTVDGPWAGRGYLPDADGRPTQMSVHGSRGGRGRMVAASAERGGVEAATTLLPVVRAGSGTHHRHEPPDTHGRRQVSDAGR